jgi:hypothetical protein
VPRSKETLKARLTRYRQIKIGVIGRKSGQTISIPVWFVLDGTNLCLLPVQARTRGPVKQVVWAREFPLTLAKTVVDSA